MFVLYPNYFGNAFRSTPVLCLPDSPEPQLPPDRRNYSPLTLSRTRSGLLSSWLRGGVLPSRAWCEEVELAPPLKKL